MLGSRVRSLRSCAHTIHRRCASGVAVSYAKQGAPAQVLSKTDVTVGDKLAGNQVLVKMLAAPVSRADLFCVAGLVPGVASAGVCGNEGVGVVEGVGSSVKGLKKGDRVVPTQLGVGTWASFAVAEEGSLAAVPADVDVEQAALLGSSAATALRVLSDVGGLAKGDVIVHDGANGSMGLPIVQIAKSKGLKVVSIVDENAVDFPAVSKQLKAAGSEVVVAAMSAGSDEFRKVCADVKPKLAVHCSSSGKSSTDLARALAPGGTLVSVAGAGPVTVPSSVLIDRGITVQGFNLGAAMAGEKGSATVAELVGLVKNGTLNQAVAGKESLDNYEAAVAAAQTANGNILFTM